VLKSEARAKRKWSVSCRKKKEHDELREPPTGRGGGPEDKKRSRPYGGGRRRSLKKGGGRRGRRSGRNDSDRSSRNPVGQAGMSIKVGGGTHSSSEGVF